MEVGLDQKNFVEDRDQVDVRLDIHALPVLTGVGALAPVALARVGEVLGRKFKTV